MAALGTGSSRTFHSEIADDIGVDAPDRLGPVSAVPIVAAGTDAATAELVSIADRTVLPLPPALSAPIYVPYDGPLPSTTTLNSSRAIFALMTLAVRPIALIKL